MTTTAFSTLIAHRVLGAAVSTKKVSQEFSTILKRNMDRIHPDDQLKVVKYAAKLT